MLRKISIITVTFKTKLYNYLPRKLFFQNRQKVHSYSSKIKFKIKVCNYSPKIIIFYQLLHHHSIIFIIPFMKFLSLSWNGHCFNSMKKKGIYIYIYIQEGKRKKKIQYWLKMKWTHLLRSLDGLLLLFVAGEIY